MMSNTSYLVFLVAVAVAVPWSNVDARNRYSGQYKFRAERDITSDELLSASDEVTELSEEAIESFARRLLADLLLLTAKKDNPAELDKLTLEFDDALEQKWDSLDDFATHLAEVYENVTGKKPDMEEVVYGEKKPKKNPEETTKLHIERSAIFHRLLLA